MNAAIRLSGICLNRGGRDLYRDFNLQVEKDSVTALLAPSGSGKTSLLECIAGLIRPQSGSIEFAEGEERVSFLFQEPRLLPWYTIEKNITLPLQSIFRKEEARDRAAFFLDQVGLFAHRKSFPDRVSGGERQRAALARAFAYPSSVLLLDEALQSQDLSLRLRLMELTEVLLAAEQRTVLLVTHDAREALALSTRCILLSGEPLAITADLREDAGTKSVAERYLEPSSRLFELESLLSGIAVSHPA